MADDAIDGVVKSMTEGLYEAISEFEALHESSWSSSEEIAKTVISVSSVVVAFTTTFSDSILKNTQSNYWVYTVCVSWILFLLSIGFSLISLWSIRQARSTAVKLLRTKPKLKTLVLQTQKSGTYESIVTMNEKAKTLLVKTVTSIHKNSLYGDRFLKASLILFVVAVLILGIIGIGRFLCF